MGIVNPLRQTKRLYIGGITEEMTEPGILDHFNALMKSKKLAAPHLQGNSVNSVTINREKAFASLEVSVSAA